MGQTTGIGNLFADLFRINGHPSTLIDMERLERVYGGYEISLLLLHPCRAFIGEEPKR